jgi:hypothetical protein
MGQRMPGALCEKYFASMRICSSTLRSEVGERAELATEFPRVTVQVSGQIVQRRNHKERTASRSTEPRRASLCSQDSVGGVLPYRTLIL